MAVNCTRERSVDLPHNFFKNYSSKKNLKILFLNCFALVALLFANQFITKKGRPRNKIEKKCKAKVLCMPTELTRAK
ncbi:hypothetical protein T01_12249 [Trichinella spiralis]|uniref:Uncharacterized protein n=1 Tax=Trichinella spiralis TaxID=6334 RepID=A0A0V1B798_TRISP|nr:hypothetical protein T01_12249 [Trichinella spiralis]